MCHRKLDLEKKTENKDIRKITFKVTIFKNSAK